ncbi:DNA endonuclease RBBP8 [Araneus ventricosus]|uniref:DNA endonuclease RBBP8 n=1 Tax=Araneus ventricosus TaxID=182803 RepID=A0A4Y2MHG5_ARAVE|nr:DNA endonuclease RBBP8 [Araneus ventricosus]
MVCESIDGGTQGCKHVQKKKRIYNHDHGLEDEIEGLKNKLFEAEKELKERGSDCKRCSELEEAFTTCKAALEEQTKWFESFGQKFSIFNSSENKVSSKTSKLQDDIVQIYNENSFASDIPQSNQTNEKSSITKKSFLKNLMNSTPDKVQDSLDLCTVAFPGNLGPSCSSLNFDSVILAPDTVDITLDVQNNALKQSRTKPKVLKSSEQLNDAKDKSKDYTERNKSSKKRTCSNSSESEKSPNKKLNKGAGNSSGEEKNVENKIKKKELIVEEHVKADHAENSNAKLRNDKTIDLFDLKTSKNNTPMDTDNIKEKKVSVFDSEITKDSNTETSVKIPSTGKEKSCHTKLEHTINKDSIYQVSPSLIPLNKKNEKAILQNQPMLAEDINDFQVPTINKNPPEIADAWKTCDKKKTKKGLSVKNIKLTSKFKMSLDALPPNYKKPNLRQTKLSKSIFQPKNSIPEDGFSNEAKKILSDSSNSSAESSKKNSPVNKSNKTSTIDFDATCIPENYKYNAESCDDEEVIQLIQDESSDESLHSPAVSPKTKVKSITKDNASKENKEKDKFEDFLCSKKQVDSENLSSFDRLPKREEPNYKYKEETVRKKSERKQLTGFECKECEKYFADLGLSEEEKRERLNKCSRHRAKFPPPATPEHFWELDFPDTQECKARGYLNETQKVTLKTHRRRPL